MRSARAADRRRQAGQRRLLDPVSLRERPAPDRSAQALQGEAFRRFVSVPRVLYDDIVVDVGAGDGPNLDTALRHADCAVVPVRPTGVDMYTMQLMDLRVAEARETNPGLRAVALINQASANPRHQALGVAVESLQKRERQPGRR